MIYRKLIYRVLIYILGLLILAFGVAFSISSDLGVSPVNSLPFIISLILGIDMGGCVVAVFLLCILAQIAVLRKEFKWIDLTQVIFSSIFGYFVDFAKSILGDFRIPTYAGQLCTLAVSVALLACGIAVYMETQLVNMPMEGLVAAIAHRLPKAAFHNVKMAMDCAIVAVSVILSLAFLGGLHGVREGTVICALCVGRLLPVIKKRITPAIKRCCFDERGEHNTI